jgi:hypothetical protein
MSVPIVVIASEAAGLGTEWWKHRTKSSCMAHLICHILWRSQVPIIIHRIGIEDFVGKEWMCIRFWSYISRRRRLGRVVITIEC